MGSGQPIRTLKLKGSIAQFSNTLGIVNQKKYPTNKKQNVDVRLQNLHRYNKEKKKHVKHWIKNALSDNNFSTQPIKKEGIFQIKVVSQKHSLFETKRQKVKRELRELEEMDGILRLLKKNQLIWARV